MSILHYLKKVPDHEPESEKTTETSPSRSVITTLNNKLFVEPYTHIIIIILYDETE